MDIWSSLITTWNNILKKFGYVRVGTKKDKDIDFGKYDITEVFANALENFSISDKKIAVVGESDRAIVLNKAMSRLNRGLGTIVTQMLHYGGVVVVPYQYDGQIYYDVVDQANIEIESIAGDKILDCIILVDEIYNKTSNSRYSLFRRYKLENKSLTIENTAWKDQNEISLEEVPEWKDTPPVVRIAGVEKMPFAYFKNPHDKRRFKGKKGVPITHGQEGLVREIEECLCEVRDEFGAKQVKLFIDEAMLNGEEKLAKMYKKTTSQGADQFDIFDPQFRDSSYYERLTQLFSLLEKKIGTSAGILTPFETKDATATAIKRASLGTYNLTEKIREEIAIGIEDYIQGCEMLINYYSIVGYGDYELKIEWGYSLVESSTETFEQLVQAQSVGAVSKSEIRQFLMPNETQEEAEQAIKEIEASEPTIQDTFGLSR